MAKLNYGRIKTDRLTSKAKQQAGQREYKRIKFLYAKLRAKKK